MKNINRYYNRIRRETPSLYHEELREVLMTAVEEYDIASDTELELVLGTPEEFVGSYLSTLEELPGRRRLGALATLGVQELTHLMVGFYAVLFLVNSLNSFIAGAPDALSYEMAAASLFVLIYLVVYRALQGTFDQWVSLAADLAHQLVSMLPALLLHFVLYLLLRGLYPATYLDFLAPALMVVVVLLATPLMGRLLTGVGQSGTDIGRYRIRKLSGRELVVDLVPKLAVSILVLGYLVPLELVTLVVSLVTCGVVFFWARSGLLGTG